MADDSEDGAVHDRQRFSVLPESYYAVNKTFRKAVPDDNSGGDYFPALCFIVAKHFTGLLLYNFVLKLSVRENICAGGKNVF